MIIEMKEFNDSKLAHPILYNMSVMSPNYAVDTVLPYLNSQDLGKSFFEVGCGTGVVSLFVATKFKIPVYAMDIDKEAIEVSKQNVLLWNESQTVTLIHSDIENCVFNNLPMVDTIFSAPPYFLNLDNKIRDVRYFAKPVFFHRLIEFAERNLTQNGKLICHINSFTTFQLFIELLKLKKFVIEEAILPNILDIRDFFSLNEFVLQNYLGDKYSLNYESQFPRGIGMNTLKLDFSRALGLQQIENTGGWIKASKLCC